MWDFIFIIDKNDLVVRPGVVVPKSGCSLAFSAVDLLLDEGGDGVGVDGGDGEEVRLGLVAVLVSNELELEQGTVGEGVAASEGSCYFYSIFSLEL